MLYDMGHMIMTPRMKATAGIAVGVLTVIAPSVGRAQPFAPEYVRPPEVRIWSYDAQRTASFPGLPQNSQGGGFVSAGDVDGDGQDEIVVGAGVGSEPLVQIFRTDGTRLKTFYAFSRTFKGGVRVAVGDTDGNGIAEIFTAPGPGTGPEIRLFDGNGVQIGGGLAYAPGFVGGIHLAAADMDGDGRDDIVTAPGPGGGPHIRIFDGRMNNLGLDYFAYDALMRDGVTVAAIRSPEGPSLVTAVESWDMPLVRTWVRDASGGRIRVATEFLAFDAASKSGLRVGSFDYDNDGNDEIVAARNGGAWPEVRIFDRWGTKAAGYLLHDPTYRGALSFAQVDAADGGRPELAVIPTAAVVSGPIVQEKLIRIDISEQRLYAYEHGRLGREFLISSGTYKYPTPVNWSTTVKEKVPMKNYRWSYGPRHPDNYNLPNVPFNLNIGGPFYIHYAYWHNNFGKRMSHGCINTGLEDAKWIYAWADVGTPVEIVP